jgi:hypothetical protein
MELFLTRNSSTNTTLTTAEGAPLYKIETSLKHWRGTTFVCRFEYGHSNDLSNSTSNVDSVTKKGKSGYNDSLDITSARWTELARIDWRLFSSSRLRFGVIEMDMAQYLRPEGLLRR